MDHETATQVTVVACWVAWLTCGTLALAILGAAYAAMADQALAWLTTPVIGGLYGALRLFLLVTLLSLLWRMGRTYLHTYRGHPVTRHGRLPESTRRRVAGSGRRFQGPGRHRKS